MFKSGIHKVVLLGYAGNEPLLGGCGCITIMPLSNAELLQGKALCAAVLGFHAPDHP